jgi:heptosyltransferase-1
MTAAPAGSALVVRPSSLGDIVYALAIVSDVARHRPGLALDWVAERPFVSLVALDTRIRHVVPVALRRWRRAPWSPTHWREAGAFARALRGERYEAVLDLQEQLKGALVARLAHGVRHGFDRRSAREPFATWLDDVHHRVPRDQHFVHRVRALAAGALGYTLDTPPRWSLARPSEPAVIPSQRYAVALTATTRADKRWPERDWSALLGRLAQAGLSVVLPWGNAEEEALARRLAQGAQNAIVPKWLSMREAAALLGSAELVVGVDTGFTHLAAVLGTATVAIFTSTDVGRHGVACTGPHALDVGDAGQPPDVDRVMRAAADVWKATPRC